MGKTRLALEAATALADHLTDGAAFVSLAPVQSATQLPEAVAEALAIDRKGGRNPGDQLLIWLAPHLQLLITSRERLRVSGERIFELGGLSLPGPTLAPEAAEAVKLFVERAQHVSSDLVLNEENKTAVARVCQLVGGMPLGIELAAAWVRVISCAEIAKEMARSLDFLVRADRDVSPRHHSMRAVFDSSWRLLAPEEQRVAARLAVLRGSFDRPAAQAIAGATLPQWPPWSINPLCALAGTSRSAQHCLYPSATGQSGLDPW